MVIYLYFIHLFIVMPLCLFSAEFHASVSSNQVGVGQSFTLNLTLKEASPKDAPSVEPLKKAFSVHSQQQSSHMTIMNGKVSSSITWKLVLTPLKEGEIVIPALAIDTSEGILSTQTIAMQITKESASGDRSSIKEEIRMTAEVTRADPYKNEPVILTVRLVAKQPLANIQVEKFDVQDAIVESAGEPVIYDHIDNGMRAAAVEFHYLVTPLRPGPLKIPSIAIQGAVPQRRTLQARSFFDDNFDPFSLMQGFNTVLKPFVMSSEEIALEVRPPALGANPWLPARSLKITENWDDLQTFQEGEIFSRSFIIEAEGLHSSQLPSLETMQNKGDQFKVYADKPELSDEMKNGTITSYRKERYTWIPQTSGDVVLPEISVAWWDTANEKKALAAVSSRSLYVLPASLRSQDTAISEGEKRVMLEDDPAASASTPFMVYALIAGLAALLIAAIVIAILLWRKMQRMLEGTSPKQSPPKPEPVSTPFLVFKKCEPDQNANQTRKREKLDDLNPT